VADAFRKEGRTEARALKQPAQLSQAASVKDLVTYYDMGHSVGDYCSAWCKTCCKDGRSKVLIDRQQAGGGGRREKGGRRKGEGGRRGGRGEGGPVYKEMSSICFLKGADFAK
jgi:hypothetical protein